MTRIVVVPLICGLAAGAVVVLGFVVFDVKDSWTVLVAGLVVAAVTAGVYAKGLPGTSESPRAAAERYATEHGTDDRPGANTAP